MSENKTAPQLWAIVTIAVAIIACIGTVTSAIIAKIPAPTLPALTPTPILIIITATPFPVSATTQITPETPIHISTATEILTDAPVPFRFMVFANQAWQDTGVTINTGDTLIIKYVSGLWRWTGSRADFDGNGDPYATGRDLGTCDDCPILDAPLESLVGKIGSNGTPFIIGNSIIYTVPNNVESNQKLFLMGNDGIYGLRDNVGSIEVSITK